MAMGISFDEKRFKNLLMLAYLGDWVLNAYKENADASYDEALSYLLSHAGAFGLKEWAEKTEGGSYVPSPKMERSALEFVEDYNQEVFWDHLMQRLADRDMAAKHGEAAVLAMTEAQRLEKRREFEDKWTKEFEDHGLERLAAKET